MPTRLDRVGVEFYPDDLLPKMQQLLAILADLDQRYETDRYHLENWSGPQAIKAHLLADLEQSYRANRQRFETCLEELRLRACLSVRFQGLTPPPQYRPSALSRLWLERPAALCSHDPCGLGSDSHGGKIFSASYWNSSLKQALSARAHIEEMPRNRGDLEPAPAMQTMH
jgi:hypothetical protein